MSDDCRFKDSEGRCNHVDKQGFGCGLNNAATCKEFQPFENATEDDIPGKCEDGKHEFSFSKYCGADVCDICGYHKGLARCFCGWSETGGDGYRELLEDGEQIEDDY